MKEIIIAGIKIIITTFGRIIRNDRFYYGYLRGDGYRCTNINGKPKTIHHLVMDSFGPKKPNEVDDYVINHIDENKENNKLENLEWLTRAQNNQAAHNVPVISFKDGISTTYPSLREAERITGISHGGIGNVCRGKQKTAGGFEWRFENSNHIINPVKKSVDVENLSDNLNDYNKTQLAEICISKQIKYSMTMRKTELINLIKAFD